MKFKHWPFRATFEVLRWIGRDGCKQVLEHALDRLKLRGYMLNKPEVSVDDTTLPVGDEWITNLKCKTDLGWKDVSVLFIRDKDGMFTFIGSKEEVVENMGNPSEFYSVEIIIGG